MGDQALSIPPAGVACGDGSGSPRVWAALGSRENNGLGKNMPPGLKKEIGESRVEGKAGSRTLHNRNRQAANSGSLRIDMDDLARALNVVCQHVREQRPGPVEIREDYYWETDPAQLCDPTKDPSRLQPWATVRRLAAPFTNTLRRSSADRLRAGVARQRPARYRPEECPLTRRAAADMAASTPDWLVRLTRIRE